MAFGQLGFVWPAHTKCASLGDSPPQKVSVRVGFVLSSSHCLVCIWQPTPAQCVSTAQNDSPAVKTCELRIS